MVDASYLEQFRNEEIWKNLVLGLDLKRVRKQIRTAKCPQTDHRLISTRDINGIEVVFAKAKESVNDFLGIDKNGIEPCSLFIDGMYDFFIGYFSNMREIRFGYDTLKKPLVELRVIFAHEYSHHVLWQMLNPIPHEDFTYLQECFALGVESGIATVFDQSESITTHRGFTDELLIRNLREASKLITLQRKIKTIEPPRIKNPDYWTTTFGVIDYRHSVGAVLSFHLEAERGSDVYRKILHGEFKW